MSRKLIIVILNVLTLLIWILSLLHVINGFKDVTNSSLHLWQLAIISFQLAFEIAVFIQITLLVQSVRIVFQNEDKMVEEIIQLTEFPNIDVYIPTRYVDPSILEMTILGCVESDYPREKLNIFIADDTPDIELSDSYKRIAEKYNVTFVNDTKNTMYKAGMLNQVLPLGNAEFITFFDFDQIPQKNIFHQFISVMNSNPEIVFVQAKKTFRELDNVFKIWSALLYGLYFEVFERSKQINESVLFAGSTACFRRDELISIGGIPEDTFTEDNGLSLNILLAGKQGKYVPIVGSIGLVPPTFNLQISQLWRWSHGASHVLHNNVWKILKSKKLSFGQKMELYGTFAISPMVFIVYLYGLTFIPLIMTDVDSNRLVISNFSTIGLVPILSSLTYAILATAAIGFSRKDDQSEVKYSNLPGFLFIALASNLLVITSGLLGILGRFGPNSKSGMWTKKVKIKSISIIGLILGILFEVLGFYWFSIGFTSSIIIVILGFTFIPSFFVVFYNEFSKSDY